MKIAIAGTGYVGLSIATLLAQHNQVMAVDIIPEKVELINQKKSPIQDDYIEEYLAHKELDLTATLDAETAYKDADFVVIAAPTNYRPQQGARQVRRGKTSENGQNARRRAGRHPRQARLFGRVRPYRPRAVFQ